MPSGPASRAAAVSTLPWTQKDVGDVLELSALQTLHDLDPHGGDVFLRGYLQMFLQTLEPALGALERHRLARDGAGLAFEAHKLKSAAAQIGATALSTRCQALIAWAARQETGWGERSLHPMLEQVRLQTARLQETLARLVQA